jgi:carboxymethylenebutenolidase
MLSGRQQSRARSSIGPLAVVLAMGLGACGKQEARQEGAGPAADRAATPGAGPEASGDTGLTGALSEEAFKSLHQLRTDQPPPLRGAMIDLPGTGTRAYLSLPARDATAPLPGLVVIQEWWGLNDHIKHWADRLAADGYAALAVDLYAGRVATTPDSAMALMQAVDEARARDILLAGHRFLAADRRIQAARRGSIGWCFGGRMSLELALQAPDLDAAVVYYGRPVTDPERLRAIKAHLLGIYGTRDASIPPDSVDALERALEAAEVKHRILRYDAGHGFANPSAANYDEKNAGAAWAEARAFLAQHVKARAGTP